MFLDAFCILPLKSRTLEYIKSFSSYRIRSQKLASLRFSNFFSDFTEQNIPGHAKHEKVLILCGFGSAKYAEAALRLSKEAEIFFLKKNIFTYTSFEQLCNISKVKVDILSKLAANYSQGFGLWAWKPFCIINTMHEVTENTQIFYIDAGCELSTQGINAFELMSKRLSRCGYLFYQLPFPECHWTDTSVLNFFGIDLNDMSGQVQATWFAIINNDKWRSIILDWAHFCILHEGVLLYSASPYHRHDQSVLSCMLKKYRDLQFIPHLDHFSPFLYFPSSWILKFPIHTLRQTGPSPFVYDLSLLHQEPPSQLNVFVRKNIALILDLITSLKLSLKFFVAK